MCDDKSFIYLNMIKELLFKHGGEGEVKGFKPSHLHPKLVGSMGLGSLVPNLSF